MQWVLPKFVKLNEYFQISEPKLVALDERMRETFKEFLYCFLSRDYVNQTDLAVINPHNSDNHIPTLYLGVKVLNDLKKPDIINKSDHLKDIPNQSQEILNYRL